MVFGGAVKRPDYKDAHIRQVDEDRGRTTHPNQSVLGLELLLGCLIVVDERKSGATSSTKVCPETEGDDTVLVRLVDARELLRDLALGDVWPRGVEDVNDELAAGQEPVGDEFAGANGNGCRGVLEERHR